jgi:hypothetical protein
MMEEYKGKKTKMKIQGEKKGKRSGKVRII